MTKSGHIYHVIHIPNIAYFVLGLLWLRIRQNEASNTTDTIIIWRFKLEYILGYNSGVSNSIIFGIMLHYSRNPTTLSFI